MSNMRPTFLKASNLEPNFSFGATTTATTMADQPSESPDSAEYSYHSEHSDFVLHKVDPNLFNYKSSAAEGISVVQAENGAKYKQKLTNHCRSKWGLYVIILFGIVSISGCVAAGIALSAVQPYLIEEELLVTPSPQANNSLADDQPVTEMSTTFSLDPDVMTRIFSTVRDAGMQETPLELRNSSFTPNTSVSSVAASLTPNASLIISVSTNDQASVASLATVFQMNSAENKVPIFPPSSTLGVKKPTSHHSTGFRSTSRTVPRSMPRRLFDIDDNREPDRFPESVLIMSDPKTHDLNITFEDPYMSYKRMPAPIALRAGKSLAKRSVKSAMDGQEKYESAIFKLGQFTMMQPNIIMKGVEPQTTNEYWSTNNPIKAKALLPAKQPVPQCESGFELNLATEGCVDIDECLQMGIRACGVNSECTNTPGAYTCRCVPGFRLDSKSLVCTDIDECKESNGECSPLALCENLPGGFVCRCMDGFYGNGIICQIDGSGATDRFDLKPSLPCQTTFPPRTHQIVSSPYYPEAFPILSRYKFCIQKMHSGCKTRITVQHFVPSTVSHQDFDYLAIQGKVLTGTDLNAQTLWLLDSRNSPIEIEFSTDSDRKGNRFTLEVMQEPCGSTLSVPECPDLLKIRGKIITSSGPHYVDNLACTSALYPPHEACGMELNFHEFSLEGPRETCPYDYLEINDDKLCGNMKNELREVIFPRNTPKIPIIFSTDGSFVSVGFNITFTWILECYNS